ncbi:PadR family transcriptional regulator [Microlunatus ginsengisoli]|uniref:Transcription regulator PadR N-terminal domain-containing protein n=1 Tax=Microlunatus ginsengisoli TaxID=363863 RepID=A0ABP7A5X6_9ACTN
MARNQTLTATSYAILGLLAIKPWTTYELAMQMDRTLNRFWPRARSKLYEEPKKLVAAGLAEAIPGAHGRRPRTVYAITPAGRLALAGWLAAESAPPVFESEQLLKVFYADNGTRADLSAGLRRLRAWVDELTGTNIEVGSSYLEGEGPYPDRMAVLVLTSRFLDDYLEMIDRWAAWAAEVVAEWPEDPSTARPDLAELARTVEQATARASRWAASGDS